MKSPYLLPCFAELMTQCSRHAFAALLFPACSRFLDESRQADIVVGTDGSETSKRFFRLLLARPGGTKSLHEHSMENGIQKTNQAPVIQQSRVMGRQIALMFSESLTVKGKPRIKMRGDGVALYLWQRHGHTVV